MTSGELKSKWSVYGIEVEQEEPNVWRVIQPMYGLCVHCRSWEEVEQEARSIIRYVDSEEQWSYL